MLAGTVVMDETVPFASAGPDPVTGSVLVRTMRGKDNKLTFSWRITNAATSKGSIKTINFDGFIKAVYDANWRSDGIGTVAPTHIVGQHSGLSTGWLLSFEFGTLIKPGETSNTFFLRTDATAFKSATASIATTKKFAFGIKTRVPAN